MPDIDQEIQDATNALNAKMATRDLLATLRAAYQTYVDALPTIQEAARQIYDPATDAFNADVEPYLSAVEKQKVRDLFA